MPPLHRFLLPLALVAALGSACHSRAARGASLLFRLEDPRGDDHGDGELRYPLREDLKPSDLDLLSLEAFAEDDGTRFEVLFARPIAVPSRARAVDLEGGTQAELARHGFYTFNLDIYIDTDRAPGSGRTQTLPGRSLALRPESGWEKALVLTPQPYEAREKLEDEWLEAARAEYQRTQGPLPESVARGLDARTRAELEARVFFATRVRVTGPKLSFTVPHAFLGGPARPDWGYAVAVTGASIERRVSLGGLFGLAKDSPAQGLMVLRIAPGTWHDRFGGGRRGDPEQSPVVDLMVPPGVRQEDVLGAAKPGWPAVVPAPPPAEAQPPQAPPAGSAPPEPLPQAPDAGAPGGQVDAPGASPPRE